VNKRHYDNLKAIVETPASNSTYKKLALQWLNEASCFVSSSVLADSLMLQNPPLRQAPKRQAVKKLAFTEKIGFFAPGF